MSIVRCVSHVTHRTRRFDIVHMRVEFGPRPDQKESETLTKMTRIEKLRGIIEGSTAAKIDGYLVDLFTAGMLVTVYDALSPENQAKFDSIPLARLVDFGWKQVKSA